MTIKRMAAALCAAFFFVGIPLTASAEVSAAPTCSSAPWTTEPVIIDYHGLWTYSYRVSWCVQNTKIVWVEPEVTHQEHDSTCTWVGSMEESVKPEPGGDGLIVFNMSEFACPAGAGTGTRGVNPWAEVTIHPDGTYREKAKGVAE